MSSNNNHNEKNIVVDVKGLKKSFNSQHVLNGLDLELHKRENLVVLGKSLGLLAADVE